MLELLIIVILWVYLILLLVVIAAYLSADATGSPFGKLNSSSQFPEISILIPARNEEQNIIKCLESILALDYPKDKLHILIGDDQSSDNTANLVEAFIEKHPHFQLISIQQTLGSAKAKGNVLANLMRLVQTEIVFVTDADIQVNPKWIKRLLPKITNENYGIVSGTTIVNGVKLFHKWQGLEWYLGTGYIAGFDQLGIPTTAVGNNMAFTKTAFYVTGGYENMPFSVTEDFQLYAAIRAKGYRSYNESHADSVNISAAQNYIKSFLHQRKRWLMGARALPWYWLFIFGLQALFYPSLIILLTLHFSLALKIWMVKIVFQQLFILTMQLRLKQSVDWLAMISFEAYSMWSTLAILGFYFSSNAMDWKGRKYD
jgi:cellulose synthase/poly-beta-1,6-N-acetylglucosamine synthase-like glycosyltransferase